jgi:hypothetical protein
VPLHRPRLMISVQRCSRLWCLLSTPAKRICTIPKRYPKKGLSVHLFVGPSLDCSTQCEMRFRPSNEQRSDWSSMSLKCGNANRLDATKMGKSRTQTPEVTPSHLCSQVWIDLMILFAYVSLLPLICVSGVILKKESAGVRVIFRSSCFPQFVE